MSDAQDHGRIERLKGYLNSRSVRYEPRDIRTELKSKVETVKQDWSATAEAMGQKIENYQGSSLSKRLFVFSIIFFICAVLLAGFILLRGANLISGNNIDISVSGPINAEGGKSLPFTVVISNNNNSELELVDLTVAYPLGTRSSDDLSVELPSYRENIGTIAPHGQIAKKLSAVLFGTEGTSATITVGVEYHIKGSNAVFEKSKDYQVTIGSAPLAVRVESVTEITSGQQIEFNVDVTSNSSAVLQDVLLKAEYPFGFVFASANPKSAYGNTVWRLGDLQPGATQRVTLRGRLEAQNGEQRTFRFSSGLQRENNEQEIEAAFAVTEQVVAVAQPFIGLSMTVNGSEAAEVAVASGRTTTVSVSWANNTTSQITNAQIEVKLEGGAFNPASVQGTGGFFRSSDNTIVWTREGVEGFSLMNPGDSGELRFSFVPTAGGSNASQSVTLSASARGERLSESGVAGSVISSAVKTVKVASDLNLTARSVYGAGPFKNAGPIPPRADSETTYTVIWTVTNSTNTVRNARVTATVPSYVRFVGAISPTQERVTFSDGTVTWQIGDVPGSKGVSPTVREVAFQVALTPSISQVGSVPVLVGGSTLTADDTFAGVPLQATRGAVSTRTSTDPGFDTGEDIVVGK